MATAGNGDVTLVAIYSGKKLSLTVPTNAKVGDVVQKAAETLNLKKEDLPLSLLYQGTAIDDTAPLETAIAKLKGVTAIHLVKRANPGKTTTARVNSIEAYPWAYCTTCEGLCRIRPIYTCSSCKEVGGFERRSQEPVDHFDGNYPPASIIGTCNHCKKTDVMPRVSFQCLSCDEGDQAILRQIRDNTHDIPCMKCSLRQEIVIQMRCSYRHCICLACFKNMCEVKLANSSFRNFDDMGYSISCPGPGDDCKHVPIIDPHHFKIVEDPSKEGSFYKRFKDEAAFNYQPSGDDILCVCRTEIAMSTARPVPTEAEKQDESQSTAAGQKWYTSWMSIFKKKQDPNTPPAPAPRKSRRRASCAECKREYCMECKSIWHIGECPVVTDKELKEQEFPIRADLARSAQWPK